MNTVPTLPPDRDLRSEARDRQRDELMAIVEHESATSPARRRVVPVAAAAAIVLVVGAAIAVPALRPDKDQSPVGGGAVATSDSPLTPLSSAERAALAPKCAPELDQPKNFTRRAKPEHPQQPHSSHQEIVDGFRYTNPPRDAAATHWVVKRAVGEWFSCGFDENGKFVTGMEASPGQSMFGVVEPMGMGTGLYLKSVRRITVTPRGGEPVEAILRDGYFYAPVRPLEMNVEGPPSTPLPYITRGYDADGKLVYTSAATVGERTKARSKCYVDPQGKLSYYLTPKPTTTTNCLKMVAWDDHPVPR
jgi:hypothetical protein